VESCLKKVRKQLINDVIKQLIYEYYLFTVKLVYKWATDIGLLIVAVDGVRGPVLWTPPLGEVPLIILFREQALCLAHVTLQAASPVVWTVCQRIFALCGLSPGDYKTFVWTALKASEYKLFALCIEVDALLIFAWLARGKRRFDQ